MSQPNSIGRTLTALFDKWRGCAGVSARAVALIAFGSVCLIAGPAATAGCALGFALVGLLSIIAVTAGRGSEPRSAGLVECRRRERIERQP
jgi:hypothetical protein